MINATRPFVVNEWINAKIDGVEISGIVEVRIIMPYFRFQLSLVLFLAFYGPKLHHLVMIIFVALHKALFECTIISVGSPLKIWLILLFIISLT